MDYEIDAAESVSVAVVNAVSAVEGRDPRRLRPLGDVLDPDALDALFDSRANGDGRTGGRLSFIYGHSRVTVDSGEYLTVELMETSPRLSRDEGRGGRTDSPTADPRQ